MSDLRRIDRSTMAGKPARTRADAPFPFALAIDAGPLAESTRHTPGPSRTERDKSTKQVGTLPLQGPLPVRRPPDAGFKRTPKTVGS